MNPYRERERERAPAREREREREIHAIYLHTHTHSLQGVLQTPAGDFFKHAAMVQYKAALLTMKSLDPNTIVVITTPLAMLGTNAAMMLTGFGSSPMLSLAMGAAVGWGTCRRGADVAKMLLTRHLSLESQKLLYDKESETENECLDSAAPLTGSAISAAMDGTNAASGAEMWNHIFTFLNKGKHAKLLDATLGEEAELAAKKAGISTAFARQMIAVFVFASQLKLLDHLLVSGAISKFVAGVMTLLPSALSKNTVVANLATYGMSAGASSSAVRGYMGLILFAGIILKNMAFGHGEDKKLNSKMVLNALRLGLRYHTVCRILESYWPLCGAVMCGWLRLWIAPTDDKGKAVTGTDSSQVSYTHAYTRACVCTRARAHTHTCQRTCQHLHTQARTRARAHTHTHMQHAHTDAHMQHAHTNTNTH